MSTTLREHKLVAHTVVPVRLIKVEGDYHVVADVFEINVEQDKEVVGCSVCMMGLTEIVETEAECPGYYDLEEG